MKLKIEIDFEDFIVPTRVTVNGFRSEPKFPMNISNDREIEISDLDVQTLTKLCDRFKESVLDQLTKPEAER